jgi:transcriptional regulator with XRE-family HTH domain
MWNGWNAQLDLFGRRVRETRHRKGLSQNALAARAGMDRTYLSDIERGRKNLSLVKIVRIARALEVDVRDLFRFSA